MSILAMFAPDEAKEIILIVLGGLGIFLFGINLLSDSLKSLAGNKLKILVEKATRTPLHGVLTGVVVTVLIQSSSATTVIIIGLISAGLMTLRQSIGVMMGANIGTTVTAFIVGIEVADYSFLIVAIGVILALFFSRRKLNLTGEAILGFGFLFLGLELMGLGLKPMSDQLWFEDAMKKLADYPILGVFTGAGLTTIVQSSSASIAVLEKLYSSSGDVFPLETALAIILGCNIGTTTTALLASIGGTTESRQASLFHLIFNLFGTILFLILLSPYVQLFKWLELNFLGPNNYLTIAFAHMFFNIVTTIAVIFLVKYFIKIVEKVIPLKKDPFMSLVDKLNEDLLVSSPVLALESAKASILEMSNIALEMVKVSKSYLNDENNDYFNECMKLEDKIDYYDHKIHDYLMQMQSFNLSLQQSSTQVVYLDTIRDLERIGDHCINLVEFFQNRYSLNCVPTEQMLIDLNDFFNKIIIQVSNAIECFRSNNINIARSILKLEDEIDRLERQYRRSQLISLESGNNTRNDIHYVDILSNLERISDHCNNIAENIIDPHYINKEILSSSK